MDPLKKLWINLFARQRFHKFNDRLLRRGLVGLGVNDFGPRSDRGERLLLKKLARALPHNAVVFDVGAYDGLYSRFLAARRRDLVIHAFEPNPVAYAQLIVGATGKFTAHPFALGDREGEATLYDPKAGGGSTCASLLGDAVKELYHDQPRLTITVPVKKLDDVMKTLGVARVDYIKIDAEGYDLMVLKGAEAGLAAGRFGIVQFEFGPAAVFSRTFIHDFYQLLPKHRLFRIVQDGVVPLGKYNPTHCELFGFQNIVAVPENATLD